MLSEKSSEHWDFYFCEIDGAPHSMMVDLSLLDVAPISEFREFYCIEIKLMYPNPENGMTTLEEFQPLENLEEFINVNLTAALKLVASQTGDCKRNFYFYGTAQAGFEALVDDFTKAFPAYETTTFKFEDADWQTYLNDLYPNAMAMNEITNRAVYIRMEEGGDDLNIPRNIDHSVIFQDRKQMKQFEKTVIEKGFSVEIKSSGIWKKTFDLLVQRIDSPSSLDPITFELERLAEDFGGSYDGWGCLQQCPAD
ncbi:MAG: DUF695 domain-containing protein [Ascidiaceihabitans sp.]|nr:DUF695 domain-containing protein [Ascidiaceihabitans sp.]